MLVKHCDFLDYLPHDTVEALSLGYLTVADLPPLLKEFIRHGVFDWESWERFLIDEIVKECEQVGDFSFSKSDFAKAIWETREKYYNEIYNRLDWEEDKLIAKKILEYFQETFDCDPALPYCALTMEQCYQIHDKLKTNGQLNIHELRSLGFTDWTRNMKDLNFREPDFNWAEIPVGK
jgi:hypothetical protein